jgi:DNA-binding transcriptional ArsR family regulator
MKKSGDPGYGHPSLQNPFSLANPYPNPAQIPGRYLRRGWKIKTRSGMDAMKRLLYWLLQGTKGGPTRINLIRILEKKPLNLRQLSLASGLDYKTVEHHVRLLMENSMLEVSGDGYGKIYFVAESVSSLKEFRDILKGGKHEGKTRD